MTMIFPSTQTNEKGKLIAQTFHNHKIAKTHVTVVFVSNHLL